MRILLCPRSSAITIAPPSAAAAPPCSRTIRICARSGSTTWSRWPTTPSTSSRSSGRRPSISTTTRRSIVATNDSPDVGFRYSVNPYRGCAHGCSYCFARPGHEYLGLSAGIDFETKILVKRRAPELFREFLARPKWTARDDRVLRRHRLLPADRARAAAHARLPGSGRRVPAAGRHHHEERAGRRATSTCCSELAAHRAVRVAVSVTTLDQALARVMEPRTSSPAARLRAIAELSAAGVADAW